MTNSMPQYVFIYRITALKNLSLFLKDGKLRAQNFVVVGDQDKYFNIFDATLHQKRATVPVPPYPGTHLHDYVPFYFCIRSPMLYTISQRNGSGTADVVAAQKEIIYLAVDPNSINEAKYRYAFSDCHAFVSYANWYTDLKDLDKLPWKDINDRKWGTYYHNGDEEPKHNKQAEFLIYKECPWSIISAIGVYDQDAKDKVEAIFKQFNDQSLVKPVVILDRNKFYY